MKTKLAMQLNLKSIVCKYKSSYNLEICGKLSQIQKKTNLSVTFEL